jgi:hypothetical protein
MIGKAVEAARVTENNTIALFPQEWKRDPESPFLSSAYHDVPWDEPAVVSACAGLIRKQNARRDRKPVATTVSSSPVISKATAASESVPASLVTKPNEI